MGCIRWMSDKGDERIEWDPEDPKQTEAAEKKFDELKAKGYDFYEEVKTKGKKVTKFAKGLGAIIAAPGVAKTPAQRSGGRAMAGGPNDMLGLGRVPEGMGAAARRELARR